jgi:acyl transferase domain-containing protein/glutamate-1-semialdehyde aminotransferase
MKNRDELSGTEIAVIGMACRFPEASNPEEFWQNLCDGNESLSKFTREELEESGVPKELINDPEYVPVRGIIKDVDKFDAELFGYNPAEASVMDPQQRIFLQIAWEALESAGYNPSDLKPTAGLFAGVGHSSYLNSQLSPLIQSTDPSEKYQLLIGNDKDFLATRVAYKLGLRGPVMTVQTACSTSLVASHLACQSLLNGECDMALAGGVTIVTPQKQGYLYQEGMILSPNGQCRAFDAKAKGTVTGNGAGIIVLKRLEDAIEDKDPIMAVILGSAVNNDGSNKIGYTAPGPLGQEAVIREALSVAEVDAESVSYVETHGTGTVLGDPIEMDSLTQTFRGETDKKSFCAIGSVKTNIGHLDTAAGVASLIKTVLMLKHKALPPTVHFEKPNPEIDFESSPFYVNDRLKEWETDKFPRRAGVSSFGIGGTNAHFIVEEFEIQEEKRLEEGSIPRVLRLCVNREETISRYAARLSDFLINNPDTSFDDTLNTLNNMRSELKYRTAFVVKNLPDLHEKLMNFVNEENVDGIVQGITNREQLSSPVFMFTGQGSQYKNMGKDLYERFPIFQQKFDQCAELFEIELGFPLKEIVYPIEGSNNSFEYDINQTICTQPALFCYEYALANLWKSFGVEPSVLIGHSIGEIVAAAYAGVFSLTDAVKLVSARCSLMQNLPVTGKMATVFQPLDLVSKKLENQEDLISIAAVNAPGSVVISGDAEAVERLCSSFIVDGIRVQPLTVSHAFHSPLMEPMLDEFRAVASSIKFNKPEIPIISNLTGVEAIDEISTPEYWVKQVRNAVLFADGVSTLLNSGNSTFIEIGPRAVLSILGEITAAQNDLAKEPSVSWIPSAHPKRSDQEELLAAVGNLWCLGYEVDWSQVDITKDSKRISLPTYPFALDRHWYESEPNNSTVISHNEKSTSHYELNIDRSKQPLKEDRALDNTVVRNELQKELKNIAGIIAGENDLDSNFFHLGIDSLMLVRVRQFAKKKYSVEIPMADFYDKVETVNKLADRISAEAKVENITAPQLNNISMQRSNPVNVDTNQASHGDKSLYEKVVAQQLGAMQQLMKDQLAALSSSVPSESSSSGTENRSEEDSDVTREVPKHLSMFQHLGKEEFTDQQQKFLDDFLPQYMEKTAGSKEFIASNREGWSDWINAVNFRFALKEILYPIVAKRSKGSRFWDVDGNEYLDLAMGYGVNFLGHNPDIVSDAIREQLDDGYQLGPQFHLTGEVVQLIRDLTGVDRVAFTNTGTEAIMAAVRIARTVTHRKTIVIFSGSYHGWYDGVLVTPDGDRTIPAFRGINSGMVEDVVMLHYGDEAALTKIRKLGKSVAAVLVEPVQSRRPGFHPKEFLHQLRDVTNDIGAALLFDEIITGFRIHPGGAQAWFDVKADMITYGKVIGGGMPVGIVSGSKKYMDALDGGGWNFGDSSYPTRDTTMFAGTFCKHPITMRVMKNVLTFLKDEGPELQEKVSNRTDNLVERLNEFYEKEDVPIRMRNFGSVFRFESFGLYDLIHNPIEMEIFFYLLNHAGVYTWERHVCFLSIQHTDEDVDTVIENVKMAITKMRAGGFTFSSKDSTTK